MCAARTSSQFWWLAMSQQLLLLLHCIVPRCAGSGMGLQLGNVAGRKAGDMPRADLADGSGQIPL